MDKEDRGNVRILSMPEGVEGSRRVVEFLLKFSKYPANDRPKAQAMLKKLPAVIARGVSRRNGEKVVEALGKLGSRAEFIAEGAVNDPLYSPLQSAAGAAAPMDMQGGKQPPAAANPAKAPKRKDRRAALALVAVLALAAGYQQGYFDAWTTPVTPAPPAPTAGRPAAPSNPAPDTMPKGDLVEYYDREFAPRFDRRLADGLAEAVREYARLFPAGEGAGSVEISYDASQAGVDDWRLVYQIKAGDTHASVETSLTTDPDRVTENARALALALKEAVGKMEGNVRLVGGIKLTGGGSAKIYREAMKIPGDKSIIEALSKLGKATGPDTVEPGALLAAGDILSWLAYFKSAHDRPNQNQIITPYAVANHLLATLFIDEGEPAMARSRGLFWQGLGYPAAAMSSVSGLPRPEEELVSVVAMRNIAGLEAVKKAGAPDSLLAYLDARFTDEVDSSRSAAAKYDSMIEKHPGFLFGLEYSIINGSVGHVGMAPAHVTMVGALHTQLALENLEISPSTVGAIMAASVSMAVEPEDKGQETLLKLRKAMLENSGPLKEKEKILTRSFIVDYLAEEARDSVYLCFQAERNVYSRLKMAGQWADLIGKVWPDSPISHLAAISNARETNDYKRIAALVDKAPMMAADVSLLTEAAEFYTWNSGNLHTVSKGAFTLRLLRRKVGPAPDELRKQANLYGRSFFLPVSRDYRRRARQMDPYNPLVYWNNFGSGDEKHLQAKNSVLMKSPTFLRAAAMWMKEQGRTDDAVNLYEKAIAISRDSGLPEELAEIYKESKEYDKAEKVIKEYLKGDDGSFAYVHGRNDLGEIYLAQGKNEQAFKLMEQNIKSWQGGALDLYARAAEALGKMDLAEDYFIMAAQRYQTGWAPGALGMFYLRQGDMNKAAAALKGYRKFNHHTYYFRAAIRHFKERENPEQIADLVRQVEGGKLELSVIIGLHDALMKAKLHQAAARITGDFIESIRPMIPAYLTIAHLDAAAMADPSSLKALVEKALEDKVNFESNWMWLAIHLHQEGHYRQAFDVYSRWSESAQGRRDDGTMLMAAAWKGSGGEDPDMRNAIEERLRLPGVNPWRALLAKYYLGEAAEEELRATMTNKSKAVQVMYAIAQDMLARGEAENAEKLMVLCLDMRADSNVFYSYAYNYLAQAAANEERDEG
ncbi:MAG: tetratricopeptide repeat protein [Nitrospinota bacterium]|nr:tetratricopeptide repeat protein [Nitrospinota bacterium]